MMDRRQWLAGAAGLAAVQMASQSLVTPALAAVAGKGPVGGTFPKGFLWGAATAPHQVEGNNTASDLWYLENMKPTVFMEPSGDATNSLELWERDLDLAQGIGLDTYRFGVEWARIEPVKGLFSQAMLDHYTRIVAGCHARGLTPLVTFNHFTAPLWFTAQGGWTNPESAELFGRYCGKVAHAIGDGIHAALTLNEPNLLKLLRAGALPPQVWAMQKETLAAAARKLGVPRMVCANVAALEDLEDLQVGLIAGHKAGKAAIKAEQPHLPVGFSISIMDDQAVGAHSVRDAMREEMYGPWLRLAREDDFVAIQNYERALWGEHGRLPAPADAVRNWAGVEVYAPSLAGAARYAHEATGRPVLITEHGVGTDDDTIRTRFITESLKHLHVAMAEGVPVLGYCHWSLIDNFEWIFGYKPHLGLATVDRTTFVRTPKPSAHVLGSIAKANAV